jgi:hypothetical protein
VDSSLQLPEVDLFPESVGRIANGVDEAPPNWPRFDGSVHRMRTAVRRAGSHLSQGSGELGSE